MNGLNGLDRPDLAFRVNGVFISLNAVLNLVLIWQFGIRGAAVATVFSAGVALVLAYYMLSRLITFQMPVLQVARQWVAALTMGVAVLALRELVEGTGVLSHNAIIVVLLVGFGAGVYFTTLLAISSDFRATVNRNLPADIPFLL